MVATVNGHVTNAILPEHQMTFEQPQEVTLPSGITVLARRASHLRLARFGGDLGVLQSLAARLTQDGVKPNSTIFDLLRDPEMRDGLFSMLDAYTRACLLRPRVVDSPEQVIDPAKQVWIEMIDEEDKQYLMTWSQGGAAAEEAADFPSEESGTGPDIGAAESVEPVPDRKRPRATTE